MARYVVVTGTEDGPVLTSPLGGVIVFDNLRKAESAAKRNGPAWVMSLHACAYYRADRIPQDG